MKQFDELKFDQNWIKFLDYLTISELNGYFDLDSLRNSFKTGAAAVSEDSGVAYPGGLLSHIVMVCALSERMYKNVSNTFKPDYKSLFKVCILHQISKLSMLIPNDVEWEVQKRGFNYKFNDTEGCLKIGERSLLLSYDIGIKFTPNEFEAMRCLDRTQEELNNAKNHLNIMSVIIKSANDIAFTVEREQWIKENSNK